MADSEYQEAFISIIICALILLMTATIILVFVVKYIQRGRVLALQEQSLRAQIEIQEHTFQMISQEIHDNVGQVLSLAKIQANMIQEYQDYSPDLINSLKGNIAKALSDLRDLSRSLNNEYLQSRDLHEVIMEEADRIRQTGLIHAHVEIQGNYQDMNATKKLILYRIVQESIQNCLKHAVASQVDIVCQYLPENMTIRINDNGIGFDPTMILAEGKGLGLANIRRRAMLAGGSHHIQSEPHRGTQISVTVPYT